jgi:hypothetical protein
MNKTRRVTMNFDFLTINHLNRNRYVKAVSILLFLLSFSIFSQSSDVPYEFPVKPGTPEWVKFQTHEEMLQACQIPENVLKNISSDALAKTCLEYPLFIDMIAYSTFNEGIERVVKQFNGLQELLGRKDAGKSLMSIYSDTSSAKLDRMFFYSYFEMLLSHDDVLKKLTNADKKALMKASLRRYRERRMNPEVYGPVSLTPVGLILGKLMRNTNTVLSAEIKTSLEKGRLTDLSTLDSIYSLASRIDAK